MHIELQNVSKSFRRTHALKDFSLNVPPSSIVALLGENGAGKSTLLRILAGLCVPDTGTVRYDGKVFDRENLPLRKRLHFTPDMPLLFPDQTVARNIATLAALYEKPTAGREDHLAHWLEETGAAALMRKTVGNLSRGQIWKAGLGSVAMIEPELW
ncbi:MAG: ABC transporter ATP-binding protein, partial [Verrucomicrobiaceae bacterium]